MVSLIAQTIRKYPEYSKKYIDENQKLSDSDIKTLKSIYDRINTS